MPLTIPCDFETVVAHDEDGNDDDGGGGVDKGRIRQVVSPRTDTIFFTGPGGAVVRPINGGKWEMTKGKGNNGKGNNGIGMGRSSSSGRTLRFTLAVPESMERRDVSIEAGTVLEMTGMAYTQNEVDELNRAYYEARESTWQVGKDLNDMSDRRNASKKWNEESQRWEKRHATENVLLSASKRVGYWMSKREQDRRNADRPDPKDLSDRGEFPGLRAASSAASADTGTADTGTADTGTSVASDDGSNMVGHGLYIASGGVVRCGENGPVMGTWYAQPITDRPASYQGYI